MPCYLYFRFLSHPGDRSFYLFTNYRPETVRNELSWYTILFSCGITRYVFFQCDPAGCMLDLFLHMAFVMVGRQISNNFGELFIPWVPFLTYTSTSFSSVCHILHADTWSGGWNVEPRRRTRRRFLVGKRITLRRKQSASVCSRNTSRWVSCSLPFYMWIT